jgi:hypothetical protein
MNRSVDSRWACPVLTGVLVLIMLSMLLGAPQPVSARPAAEGEITRYVSTTGSDDSNDCIAPETPCLTINHAIGQSVNGDTIKVAVGTYTGSGSQVVLINKSITLSGGWDEAFETQIDRSTIDGEGARRGITINADTTIVVEYFTIQNGFHISRGGGIDNLGNLILNYTIINNNISLQNAGGIFNQGSLTINNGIINSNSAVNFMYGSGGGIASNGVLIINNSTISKNAARKSGGGISSVYFEINNSTVTENVAGDNSGGAGGGVFGDSGIINNSTISNNKVFWEYGEGSGIFSNVITLNNSTISGNQGGKGGINNAGTLTLNNSTITNNTPRGIYNNNTLILKNTIIAGNGSKGDCYNESPYSSLAILSEGYNLIGNATGCSFTKKTGDRVGTNSKPIYPGLAPLQDNGGITFTHALYANSPAVNTGSPDTCLPTDQRGVDRPVGAACDMGAYEGSIPAITPITKSPYAVIVQTTPTFKWSKISGATAYQLQVFKGKKVVYTNTVSSKACKSSTCSNTPTKILSLGNNYKWRVRAKINGEWKLYSPYRSFSVSAAKPGRWTWSDDSPRFYVLNSKVVVTGFSILVNSPSCGTRRITHSKDAVINGKKFSLTGGFSVTGTFTSTTQVSGSLSLKDYYIPNCGYATGGPFPWEAKWVSTAQPKSAKGGVDIFPQNLLLPEGESPFNLFEVRGEE